MDETRYGRITTLEGMLEDAIDDISAALLFYEANVNDFDMVKFQRGGTLLRTAISKCMEGKRLARSITEDHVGDESK